MRTQSITLTLLIISITVISFNVFSVIPVTNNTETVLQPTPKFRVITQKVISQLQSNHYQPLKINDTFSQALLNEYLDSLDVSRIFFTEDDINHFKPYHNKLDNALKLGNVDIAFDIFNIFHKRRIARNQYMTTLLNEGVNQLDFSKDEFILINNENRPWAKNINELHDVWRKQFKNDVLNLLLNDKTNDEITEKLTTRYTNQLKLIQESNSDDVYAIFMSVYTGMYDPHTIYMPPHDSENFDISMKLSLEGIGALLRRENEYTKIVNLIAAGPAEKTGKIKPDDKILSIAQGEKGKMIDVIGWRLDDVIDLIRGKKGTTVRLHLLSTDATGNDTEIEVSVIRDTVKLEEQTAQKKIIEIERNNTKYRVGMIKLPTFYRDFKAAAARNPNYKSSAYDTHQLITELQAENIDALIIDLRNNGGGSLQEAGILTGLFIKTGPIVQVRDSRGRIEPMLDNDPKIAYSGPLAVMVNRASASASEIFAGAIQDSGRGIVVGQRTFGKGTVQTLGGINPGRLKYTQATFYRISGDSTQHRGVIPDITLPSYINEEKTGESTEKHALPWNQIKALSYRKLPVLDKILDEVRESHKQRMISDKEFQYLNDHIALIEENRNKDKLSLNKTIRQNEQAKSKSTLLTLENNYRKEKGLPPYKTFQELESENLSEDDKTDLLTTETANILLDYKQLAKRYSQQHASKQADESRFQ